MTFSLEDLHIPQESPAHEEAAPTAKPELGRIDDGPDAHLHRNPPVRADLSEEVSSSKTPNRETHSFRDQLRRQLGQ
jgi:hypothetical protein